MRKRSAITPVCSGLAILAGSFSFMGTAQTVTLVSENFEGGVNLFAAPTYNYSALYTLPNLLSPGGGLKYLNGGAGISGSASTNIYTATGSPLSLVGGGISGGQIDAGAVTYSLLGQFSTYRTQGDHGTLAVQFLDAGSSPLGPELRIGGAAFVSTLGLGISGYGNPDFTDMRDWGTDALAGLVPFGARFASVQIFEVKTPGGGNIDGYMDNVNVSISVVPEPGSLALLALGGGLLALARRRR